MLVHLFELDSVRNSAEEIKIGQQALFEEIVKETVEKLKELTGDFSNREKQLQPEEYDRILMEFIWENRDIARILMDGAEGTRYDNFREDTCIRMEQFLRENLQKKCGDCEGNPHHHS